MSVFQNVLIFFHEIGLYDVVLPFLLVFTLVYALLDKTRVLGIERVGDKEFAKRNINSMVAFVIAFFVIASTQLVAMISQIVAHTVMLLLLIFLFMLLVGSMHRDTKEGFQLEGWTKSTFYVIMFVGIILIFLNAFGWLQMLWQLMMTGWWTSQLFGVVVLIIILVGVMAFVVWSPDRGGES